MIHQHIASLSKHSKKTRVRRNQASEPYQVIMSTLTKLVAQESTIPTHATPGRCPFFAQSIPRAGLPFNTIQPWAYKDNLLLLVSRGINPHWVHRYSHRLFPSGYIVGFTRLAHNKTFNSHRTTRSKALCWVTDFADSTLKST